MKKCWKCKIDQQLTEFYKNRTQPDGHEGLCKPCKQAYNKKKGYDKWEYKKTKWEGKGGYGIYKFTNTDTQEIYIGKGWLVERKYDHFYKLKKQIHDNPFWQESYNNNPDCWEYEVLEECALELGLVKESEYIISELKKNQEKLLNVKLTLRF
jgi:hypothetical protein|tara:strand:- start:45 stop:503 length:459 start_codon:yes stop_codon:yes gene_type:complete